MVTWLEHKDQDVTGLIAYTYATSPYINTEAGTGNFPKTLPTADQQVPFSSSLVLQSNTSLTSGAFWFGAGGKRTVGS